MKGIFVHLSESKIQSWISRLSLSKDLNLSQILGTQMKRRYSIESHTQKNKQINLESTLS